MFVKEEEEAAGEVEEADSTGADLALLVAMWSAEVEEVQGI